VIAGVHTLLYADDAEAARAFFRDVLDLPYVDAHGGWLIFALPPGELGIHPVETQTHRAGHAELWLMCHDLDAAIAQLEAKGVELTHVTEESFGRWTRLNVPGAGPIHLYQPAHASPLAEFGVEPAHPATQ
jgi:catechol 2,3-dioxygenase-like lactoylglutathione lyase family enzyme